MPTGFDYQEIHSPSTTPERQSISLTNIGELMMEPDPAYDWVIEGLLLRGGFGLLCGKPKTGKSTLSRCLALAVARGQDFLGRKTEAGRVIMYSLEDHRHMLKKSFAQLGATGDEDILIHCGSSRGGSIRQLEKVIDQYSPTLVIIDTVFLFSKCFDVNSYTAVLESLTPLADLARDSQVHVLGVHHAGKADRADSLDSVLGSVAVHGSATTTLLMRKTAHQRVIESQQRYGASMEPTTLNFDSTTGWIEAGLLLADVEANRLADDILDFLSAQETGITETEISASVSGRTSTKRRALRSLVESEEIKRVGRGGKNDPYRYQV